MIVSKLAFGAVVERMFQGIGRKDTYNGSIESIHSMQFCSLINLLRGSYPCEQDIYIYSMKINITDEGLLEMVGPATIGWLYFSIRRLHRQTDTDVYFFRTLQKGRAKRNLPPTRTRAPHHCSIASIA